MPDFNTTSMPRTGVVDSHNTPPMTQAIGPTEHLQTADYWRGLYCDAIAVGQETLDRVHELEREVALLRSRL
jgi:hypothetical protein